MRSQILTYRSQIIGSSSHTNLLHVTMRFSTFAICPMGCRSAWMSGQLRPRGSYPRTLPSSSQPRMNSKAAIHITRLPQEIIALILFHSDSADHLKLLMTCKIFRRLPKPISYTMKDLVQIELWPAYNPAGPFSSGIGPNLTDKDYFACRCCLRLRTAQHFANIQVKRKRGKNASESNTPQRMKRICIDCAVTTGTYKRGLLIEYGGAEAVACEGELGSDIGVVCKECGQFGRVARRHQARVRWCEVCSDAWLRKKELEMMYGPEVEICTFFVSDRAQYSS